MHGLDGFAMEIESFAGLIDAISMLVEPKADRIENGRLIVNAPDADVIDESFFAIAVGLRRIAEEMRIQFEMQVQEEKEAEQFMNMPEMMEGKEDDCT
jgi:hypothetical protein